ncbi:MAG: hypothetical protein GWP69_01410 [Gammaproteobacteria bacterium]|nr:hypothetical protein [Gammaproteobacteria bacterium]NCF81557.1 hypothetical protein [Pseudomonadota bacterium]
MLKRNDEPEGFCQDDQPDDPNRSGVASIIREGANEKKPGDATGSLEHSRGTERRAGVQVRERSLRALHDQHCPGEKR